MRSILGSALLLVAATAATAVAEERDARLLREAGGAFRDLLGVPETRIPEKLLEDCRCVAVFPGVLKGALGWGARRGHGVLSCREPGSGWSAPLFMTVTGGSFGLQMGVEKSDLVLFLMNERSARSLVRREFTLGAKGSAAAGPLGRSAEGSTDLRLDAEIYSYARSKGLFAGLSLEGARVNVDGKANQRFYGRPVTADEILFARKLPPPRDARPFLEALPDPSAESKAWHREGQGGDD